MRAAADDGQRPGRFILTGSASPADDATATPAPAAYSASGCEAMSSSETGLSSAEVGLDDLFNANTGFVERGAGDLVDVIEAACRGGWPASFGTSSRPLVAPIYAKSYLGEICRADIPLLGTRRSPTRLMKLLRSLARNIATEASHRTLAADTGSDWPLDPRTVGAYLEALENVFVVEDVPAWSARLRSRARLRQAPKRHLADPSLAVAALDADPARLRADLETSRLSQFEALVVRDLRVYTQQARCALSQGRVPRQR